MNVPQRKMLVDIEAVAMRDLFALATPAENRALGLYCQTHGNTLVLACTAEDSVVLNHTIGFGEGDLARLDDIATVYRARKVPRAFLCVDDDETALVAALSRRGLKEGRAWRKFVRDAAPAAPSTTDLEVRRIGPEHGEAFGRIVAAAFDMPAAMTPVLARLAGHERWTVFMSFDDGKAAGAGAMRVHGQAAYLTFGATDPAFRQRGSQGAIMAARIEAARSAGVKTLVTETGEAVPGDPQHSWKNIERAGFRPVYRIRNFALGGN